MTRLVPITDDNWRRAAAVQVADGQLRFIADYEPVALVILAKAFVRAAGRDWWPYVIEDAGSVVGVLGLLDDRQLHGEIALFHLLIDANRQRRGYGRSALRRVVELANQLDNCARLRLTVHPDNEAAISLYASEGFTRDGVDADGELRMFIAISGSAT
jgi:diamine N-acetyltransferase